MIDLFTIKRELTLLESVIRAWKDFDTSPGEPVWKKRPMVTTV